MTSDDEKGERVFKVSFNTGQSILCGPSSEFTARKLSHPFLCYGCCTPPPIPETFQSLFDGAITLRMV